MITEDLQTIDEKPLLNLVVKSEETEQLQDFFYFLNHLIQIYGSDEDLTRLGEKKLTIKPKPSLGFPARDIDGLSEDASELFLVCQFMGLYGVDSPLPFYLNQACLQDNPLGQSMRAFFDIFNHRNYVLYFMAWRAFYPEAAEVCGKNDYLDFVKAMAGRELEDQALPLAHCLGKNHLSSLYALLNYLLPDIDVRIRECIPQWVEIENVVILGACHLHPQLGENTLLGEALVDCSQSLQICLGPLPWKKAQPLLPTTPLARQLQSVLQNHLQSTARFQLQLAVQMDDADCVVLGQSPAYLGWQTWVGHWQNDNYEVSFLPA